MRFLEEDFESHGREKIRIFFLFMIISFVVSLFFFFVFGRWFLCQGYIFSRGIYLTTVPPRGGGKDKHGSLTGGKIRIHA